MLLLSLNRWSTRTIQCGPANFDGGFQAKPAKFKPSPTVWKLLGSGNSLKTPRIVGFMPTTRGSFAAPMEYESTQLLVTPPPHTGTPGRRLPLASTSWPELAVTLALFTVMAPLTKRKMPLLTTESV